MGGPSYKAKPVRLRGARLSRDERRRMNQMIAKGNSPEMIANVMGLALATVNAMLAGAEPMRIEADGRHGGMR